MDHKNIETGAFSFSHLADKGEIQVGIWFAFPLFIWFLGIWETVAYMRKHGWTACPGLIGIHPTHEGRVRSTLGGMKFPPTICWWPTLPNPASWNDKFTKNINHKRDITELHNDMWMHQINKCTHIHIDIYTWICHVFAYIVKWNECIIKAFIWNFQTISVVCFIHFFFRDVF